MKIQFSKYHGIKNDYVLIDEIKTKIKLAKKDIINILDRRGGIGADGLILMCLSKKADFMMRIFNADGSEAEMCGNGIRCLAKFALDEKFLNAKSFSIETKAGIKHIEVLENCTESAVVKVDMGEPILEREKIPVRTNQHPQNLKITVDKKTFSAVAVSIGNPHCVIFVDDVDRFDVNRYGQIVEGHKIFPRRTNCEFVEVVNKKLVKQRTYERGVGETYACGTGACAVCVAAVLKNFCNNKITVKLLGGNLTVEWLNFKNIFITGKAKKIFEGSFSI